VDASEYQRLAMRTANPTADDAAALTVAALGLCGETGEFAEHVKKHLFQGHPFDRDLARKELGDVAWYLARACTAIGGDLGEVLSENIAKLRARYPAGFTAEASRDRTD